MGVFYNKKGEVIDRATWGKLFEDMPYRRIEDTRLPNNYRVSTVWLGIDHSFSDGKEIFETMVFYGDDMGDVDMERYATEEEAIAGHERMVEKWRSIKARIK